MPTTPTYSVWTPEQVKEYVEAIHIEHQKAITEATLEREKSAQALAISLANSIREGDERLREHVAQQVKQIEAALDATRRETGFAHESSQKAIEKAETATEKRFDAVNAFREELADRWTQTMPREVAEAQMFEIKKSVEAVATANEARLDQAREERHRLLPRETFDTAQAEWTRWRSTVEQALAEAGGFDKAKEKGSDVGRAWMIAGIGFLLTIVSLLMVAGDVLTP